MNVSNINPGTTGGNKEWLSGAITILEPESTPFVSSLRKVTGAKSTFHEVVADTLRGVKVSGTAEGDSGMKGGNKAKNRQRFGAYLGRYQETFGVTDVQQAVSRNGGVHGISDEYGNSKTKAIRELKRDLEASALSSLDTVGGSDAAMRMRGALSWLASSQTPAIPAAFLCPAAQRITGQSTLLETGANSLTAVLQSLFNTTNGRNNYDGYIGSDYALDVDKFTRTGPEISSGNTRVVYDGETAKTIRLNVEIFDTTFGVVSLIPSTFLNISTDGGTGDTTHLLLTNPKFWSMEFLEDLHAADDEEDSGGMSGYVKAIGGVFCSMPKGNATIGS
jgi:hypothetical protein